MTVVRPHQHDSHAGTLAVAHQPILDALSYPNIDYRESLARASERVDPPLCTSCGTELDREQVSHSGRCKWKV